MFVKLFIFQSFCKPNWHHVHCIFFTKFFWILINTTNQLINWTKSKPLHWLCIAGSCVLVNSDKNKTLSKSCYVTRCTVNNLKNPELCFYRLTTHTHTHTHTHTRTHTHTHTHTYIFQHLKWIKNITDVNYQEMPPQVQRPACKILIQCICTFLWIHTLTLSTFEERSSPSATRTE